MPPPPFTCPRCSKTSQHPDDADNGYCGACHAFTLAALRLRLYIGGMVTDEQWVDSADLVEEIGQRHQDAAAEADARGIAWLVEIYDPAAPQEAAYLRFGTDEAGMVMPQQVKTWPWMK
jgi:hypothetical protein